MFFCQQWYMSWTMVQSFEMYGQVAVFLFLRMDNVIWIHVEQWVYSDINAVSISPDECYFLILPTQT